MLYDTLYSTYTRENAVMMVASPMGILVREEDTQAKRSVENPRQGWIEEIRDISRRAAKQEKEQGKEETTKGRKKRRRERKKHKVPILLTFHELKSSRTKVEGGVFWYN